jgi:DNA-binding XRE family transcriptional regulator
MNRHTDYGPRPPASPLVEAATQAGLPKPWLAVVDTDMVRKLRCELGISQDELADRASVSRRKVRELESQPTGRCMPYIASLLAMALHVDYTVIVRELITTPRKDKQ